MHEINDCGKERSSTKQSTWCKWLFTKEMRGFALVTQSACYVCCTVWSHRSWQGALKSTAAWCSTYRRHVWSVAWIVWNVCVCAHVHCVHQSVLCLSTGVSPAWVMGILMCWRLHTLQHPVTGSCNAAFTFRVHIWMLDPAQIGNSHSNPKVQW